MFLKRPIVVFSLIALLLAGCLSIDATPLREQAPYLQTKQLLEKLQPVGGPNRSAEPLLTGVAKVEITPPTGIPLAGYGKRKGRSSTGIHDPLYTRALALSDGSQTVVILANDLLAITDDLYKAVYKKVSREIPLKPDALIISASHTHSGPGALAKKFWEGFAAGPFEPEFFEATTRKMASAVVSAYHHMRPARLGGGSIAVPEMIRNRMIADGLTDPALSFLVLKTSDPVTTIYWVNYSAHPTILKDDNYDVSGDFPGALSRRLEEDKDVTALYTAGAVADMTANPPPGKDDFEKAEKMGRILAEKVLDASQSVVYQDRVRVETVLVPIHLPPTQLKLGVDRRLATPLGNLFFDRESMVQAILIGDYFLLGVRCDLSAEIGLEIKQQAKNYQLHALIIGFANDYIGYIIPQKYYSSNAYESWMSFNGPYMDVYIKEIIFDLMQKFIESGQPRSGH